MIGGDGVALVTTLTLTVGRCWAGGAQYGLTPLSIANDKGHILIVQMLEASQVRRLLRKAEDDLSTSYSRGSPQSSLR